jgi:hypothetical protein
MAGTSGSAEGLGLYYPDRGKAQEPVSVGVVMTTVMRPVIERAIRSVYEQASVERIQILVGVDVPGPFSNKLHSLLEERPNHVSAVTLILPYSTSARNGGVHHAWDGGSLRSIMSFMANSRYVAYLDDDNSWTPQHLCKLLDAIRGKVWAHSLRTLVHEATEEAICVDRWDSVGVDRGRFAKLGGFVDPNCLMVDKTLAAEALSRWCENGTGQPGRANDRNFFAAIRRAPHGTVQEATVDYRVRSTNVMLKYLKEGREF